MAGESLITKHGGGMVNAYGASEAQAENNQLRADLLDRIEYLQSFSNPLAATLESGLAPGGGLRELLAAGGQTQATQNMVDSINESRRLGSRTSARAKMLGGQSAIGGYTEADAMAQIQADKMLMQQLLEQLGQSALLSQQPAENKMAPYAGAIRGAGDVYSTYSSGKQQQDQQGEDYGTF